VNVEILRFENGAPIGSRPDEVSEESPLEIRVEGEPLSVAMRTPGHDRELAAGWLLSEGIVASSADIADIVAQPGERSSMVDVMLRSPSAFDAAKHKRAVLSNSSCGLCGVATVAQVMRDFPRIESTATISAATLHRLPARLGENQPGFQRTGGLHACALFSEAGELLALREDVGRHNALDKLLGWALLSGRDVSECVLMLSGRVSFEMAQKALAARIAIIAAIGAPTSLAVELARASGQTLAAFLKERTFNCYCGAQRIRQ
jgi:FdhD protein